MKHNGKRPVMQAQQQEITDTRATVKSHELKSKVFTYSKSIRKGSKYFVKNENLHGFLLIIVSIFLFQKTGYFEYNTIKMSISICIFSVTEIPIMFKVAFRQKSKSHLISVPGNFPFLNALKQSEDLWISFVFRALWLSLLRNFIQKCLYSGSAQAQYLFAACWRFAMRRTFINGFSWKKDLTSFDGQAFRENKLSSSLLSSIGTLA